MIYFTADLHFGHDKIIKHCNRPFTDSEKMNQVLVRNWNNRVNPSDDVFILGDITMKGSDYAANLLGQLKGKKHLIKGNHDKFVEHPSFHHELFVWVKDYYELEYQNQLFTLFHYPMAEWNQFFRGSIHLHGHQHNRIDYNYRNLEQGIKRFDVGVDANNMAPVLVDDIIAFFAMTL